MRSETVSNLPANLVTEKEFVGKKAQISLDLTEQAVGRMAQHLYVPTPSKFFQKGQLSSAWENAWGAAPRVEQYKTMQLILSEAKGLSIQERVLLLCIARVESGFNPKAKNPSSTASGVFQIINATAAALGLKLEERFDAKANISAMLKLFDEYQRRIKKKYPNASEEEWVLLTYALHHDGPSLKYGGYELAKELVLPLYKRTLYSTIGSFSFTGLSTIEHGRSSVPANDTKDTYTKHHRFSS